MPLVDQRRITLSGPHPAARNGWVHQPNEPLVSRLSYFSYLLFAPLPSHVRRRKASPKSTKKRCSSLA